MCYHMSLQLFLELFNQAEIKQVATKWAAKFQGI